MQLTLPWVLTTPASRLGGLFSALVDANKTPRMPDLKGKVRAEQFDMMMRLVPFAVLVSLGVVQVICFLFWSLASRTYLVCLDAGMVSIAFLALGCCRWWRLNRLHRDVEPEFIFGAILVAFLYGSLLGSVPFMLFVGANAELRLLVAASAAGLIATCMSAAVMPTAAISYASPIIVGSMAALIMTGEPFYIYVAVLLVFYAMFLFFTIVHLSRLMVARVLAQVDLERQKEFTKLLLNEFEQNASDWLWEADRNLRLHNVSARLADVAGMSEAALEGLPLGLLLSPTARNVTGDVSAVWPLILGNQTFNQLVTPVQIAGVTRWWSLSGKPIIDPLGALVGYRGVGSDVTEKKQSEERLSYLALHDPLTEMPNRVLFQNTLDSCRRELDAGHQFGVLCLDLDGLKNVNDTFGHAAGDMLLRAVADRVQRFSSSYRLAARLAGDEFAILVTGPSASMAQAVVGLASSLVDAINEPFRLDDIRVNIGLSIGIATAPPDDVSKLMQHADLALYRMKSEGRNGFRVFEATMDERMEARRALKAELRDALDRNEFVLHFQPIVGAADGAVKGFEALVRWQHPVRGMVPPDAFISIAEETGLIIRLGEWILHEACRIAAGWPAHLSVAVNLSPIQFRHSDIPAMVSEVLRTTGLAANRLELEIIESVFLEATPTVKAQLEQMRALGVRLSLDDFGTGYSSLSYLRRVPFDKIKIDRSFVRDLPGDTVGLSIIRTIIELGNSLGMTITAEGIETSAQRDCLAALGCHQLQGYLFGRPAPNQIPLRISADGGSEPI